MDGNVCTSVIFLSFLHPELEHKVYCMLRLLFQHSSYSRRAVGVGIFVLCRVWRRRCARIFEDVAIYLQIIALAVLFVEANVAFSTHLNMSTSSNDVALAITVDEWFVFLDTLPDERVRVAVNCANGDGAWQLALDAAHPVVTGLRARGEEKGASCSVAQTYEGAEIRVDETNVLLNEQLPDDEFGIRVANHDYIARAEVAQLTKRRDEAIRHAKDVEKRLKAEARKAADFDTRLQRGVKILMKSKIAHYEMRQ